MCHEHINKLQNPKLQKDFKLLLITSKDICNIITIFKTTCDGVIVMSQLQKLHKPPQKICDEIVQCITGSEIITIYSRLGVSVNP